MRVMMTLNENGELLYTDLERVSVDELLCISLALQEYSKSKHIHPISKRMAIELEKQIHDGGFNG